ncbi:MAG: aspartate 1-decarboxylase [Kiritimatiellae bacterium]|nr:aspartate 1-decarboxylase [Kiritimatiellia bacterium]
MNIYMFKSKIHRATLTGTHLDYEGSISIDTDLLKASGILPGEQVHVVNLNNGSRLVTYVIEDEKGSGSIMLNGPAARLGLKGDKIVIIAYCQMDEEEAKTFKPTVVTVDEKNRQI